MELLAFGHAVAAPAGRIGTLGVLQILVLGIAIGLPLLGSPAHGASAAEDDDPHSGSALVRLWDQDMGHGVGELISVAEGRVATATADRRVALHNLATGKRLWQEKVGKGTQAGVQIAGSYVLGVTDLPDGELFCLSAESGNELWKVALGESQGAPLVVGERVFAASVPGRVASCSLATGRRLWEVVCPGIIRTRLCMLDSLVLVSTVADTLLALNAATGQPVWGAAPGGALYGPPVLSRGLLWTLTYEGVISGRDPATGEERCRTRLDGPFRCGLAVADGMLIVLSTRGSLTGIRAASLEPVWTHQIGCVVNVPPSVGAGYVWTVARNGELSAFRPVDGVRELSVSVPESPTTPVTLAEPYVLVGSTSGDVVAFRLRGPGTNQQVPGLQRGEGSALLPGAKGVRPRDPGPRLAAGSPSERRAAHLWQLPLGGGGVSGAGATRPAWLGVDLASTMETGAEAEGGRSWLGGGRIWTAIWLLGMGGALILQQEADDAHESYERTGDPARREEAWDRAERYDRWTLGMWVAAELCFLMALRSWLAAD